DKAIEFANGGIDQVNSSVNFTLGAGVENLTLTGTAFNTGFGTGNDLANKITGNATDNFLNGLGGNDTLIGNDGNDDLEGGTGADSMVGGAGNDNYFVDDVGDKIAESGPSIDGVASSITYSLGANLENLTLANGASIDGTGNSLNNFMIGNSGDNILSGLAGDDDLHGTGGNDLLLGGDGNDTLVAGQGGDTLAGGAGKDVFQLPDFGLNGVDTIVDLNALGGDTIEVGGVLINFVPGVSNIDAFLKTSTVNGNTIVQVDQDGAVATLGFVDMAVLQGVSTDIAGLRANGVLVQGGVVLASSTIPIQGGTADDNTAGTVLSDLMFGLGGNDTLTGDAGADTLDGGAGTDALAGGAGNDTYVIDNAGDKIGESGGGTDDRILASISIDLTAYAGIEHVTLTGS